MELGYKVCAQDVTTEFTEKKSRFISYLAYVETESEAKDFRLGLIDKNDIRLEGYEAAKRQSYGQMYFGREGLSLGPNFLFMAGNEEEDKKSELYIQGQIYTKEGTIGPWYIDEDSLSFGENS